MKDFSNQRIIHIKRNFFFSDETPSHKESLEHLRVNSDFVGYIVLVALQKLQQLVDKGTCDETNCSPQKVFEYCCTLAR